MTDLEESIQSDFGVQQPDDIKTIASLFKPRLIEKGDYVLEEGQAGDKIWYVRSGFLRMFRYHNDKEVTQWISFKGYFAFDLSSFFFQSPSRWSIQALTDTEVLVISKNDYNTLSDRVSEWKNIEKLFLVGCFATMENRIFNLLSMSSQERYEYFFQHNRELFNQVPLQYLASMLGMTPETMSRIRKLQSGSTS